MIRTSHSPRHYYNNVLITPWPFLTVVCFFSGAFLSILLINKHFFISPTISAYTVGMLFYMAVEAIIAWSEEVTDESFYGKYTKKLRAAFVFGFFLFLLSEIMLFGSFFWVYFDRLFHVTYITGFLSVPTTVETIRWFKEPLYATLVLFASGWMSNCALYFYKHNHVSYLLQAYLFSLLSNILGCVFLYIQYLEYTHLTFSISDTVFCSLFFTLTGFHGIHVIIGNIFLAIQYYLKFIHYDFKVQCLSFAVIYWHLVDLIWLFLFIFVYVYNNMDYLYVMESFNYEYL